MNGCPRLRRFWQELSRRVSERGEGWVPRRVRRWLAGAPHASAMPRLGRTEPRASSR